MRRLTGRRGEQWTRRFGGQRRDWIATACGLAMTVGGLDAVVLVAAGTPPAPVIAKRRRRCGNPVRRLAGLTRGRLHEGFALDQIITVGDVMDDVAPHHGSSASRTFKGRRLTEVVAQVTMLMARSRGNGSPLGVAVIAIPSTFKTSWWKMETQASEGVATRPMPRRLRREPLIEVIWQVQFSGESVGQVLPGMLYAALRDRRPRLRISRLPLADLPAPLRDADAGLRYAPAMRMDDPDSSFIWQVGDRIVSLNCGKPYVGWQQFKRGIEETIGLLEGSKLELKLGRHSIRYLDLLTLDALPNIAALQLEVKLGGHQLGSDELNLQTRIADGGCVHSVRISSPATANLPAGRVDGTLVDLETAAASNPAHWGTAREQLEQLHDRSKALFFQHVLSSTALLQLEPEY